MNGNTNVNVGDVILAKHKFTGEKYFAFGEVDDDCPWSFEEDPIGSAISWNRDFVIGDVNTRPEWFWADVIQKLYGWGDDDTPITDEEFYDYKDKARQLLQLLLDNTSYEIVSRDEFNSRRKSLNSSCEVYEDNDYYVALPNYSYQQLNYMRWAALTTNNLDELKYEDAEAIWSLVYDLSIYEYEQIASQFTEFAFARIQGKFHGCMGYITAHPIKDREKAEPKWYKTDGYFYCYRKDNSEYWVPDWKDRYYEYIEEITQEFNCLNNYQSYWFCSAPVKAVKKLYEETAEAMKKGCEKLNSEGATDLTLVSLFTNELLSLREYIQEAKGDSCGGYVDEDYFGVFKTYLDDLQLEFIGVVDTRVKEK